MHLSWNEWWEGSNLEPCREFGKTYCEKNLLYATVMRLAFGSIHNTGRDAQVALLLNDWRFTSGAKHHEELYDTIQILRRLGVPFDLVPDDQVTAEQLDRFRLVVAPVYGCGLGHNARREPILDVLAAWLKGGRRRLIVSGHPSVAELLGLEEIASPPPNSDAGRGDDLNVLIDVGSEGDERFLRSGFSHREPRGPEQTFRWIPGDGNETVLVLPASPNRDHVLRVHGDAIWPNTISVRVNGHAGGDLEVPSGEVTLEAKIPAAVIGSDPVVWLALRHAELHVPGKKAPQVYKGEARICNLTLNSVQWSTANVPAGSEKQQYTLPGDTIRLIADLFGAPGHSIDVPIQHRRRVGTSGAKVLSVVEPRKTPRDLLVPFGPSEVIYTGGPLSEIDLDNYWLPLVRRWAGVEFHRFAVTKHCMASRLNSGDTDFVVCFNEQITQARRLRLSLSIKDLPLAEAAILTRDGRTHHPLAFRSDGFGHHVEDLLRYYGVYQFAYSPVKVQTPELVLQPGQSKTFSAKVTNLTSKPVRGQIQANAVIPTITGKPVAVELEPGQTAAVELPIDAAATADWGRKTIYLELVFNGRRAVVLRELIVQKPPEIELVNVIVDAAGPKLGLRVPNNPYGQTAPLTGARLTFRDHSIELPTVVEGGQAVVALPAVDLPAASQPVLKAETVRIDPKRPQAARPIEREVFLAAKPKSYDWPAGAAAALVVLNPRSEPLVHELVTAEVSGQSGPVTVRALGGSAVPAQLDASGRLEFLVDVPARSGRTFFLCRAEEKSRSDLRVTATDLGTGKGTLSLENTHLSITLSEAAGGTVTEFRSLKTGRQYGKRSFGVNHGTFSRHDPTKPRTDTVQYIHESKVRQEDSPGRITLISEGPAVAVARVQWADEKVQVDQTYRLGAHRAYFTIRQKVTPIDLSDRQELVAVDAQFVPNGLTKSYPNFVGVPSDAEQPHFGWRQGTWVPEYVSLLAPDQFDESISLVIARGRGLTAIRQGFWPAERPKPGKREFARIELLADTAAGCDAEIYVLVHPGHQIVAEQFLADLRTPPRVDVVRNSK